MNDPYNIALSLRLAEQEKARRDLFARVTAGLRVVPAGGVEPPTFGLQHRCSTTLSYTGAETGISVRQDTAVMAERG